MSLNLTIEQMYELSKDIMAFDNWGSQNPSSYLKIIASAKDDFSNVEYKLKSFYNANDNWQPKTNVNIVNFQDYYYRIVPEELEPKPKEYKPYTETKSEWLGKTVIEKQAIQNQAIHGIAEYLVVGRFGIFVIVGRLRLSLEDFFNGYTWADGSPCGELE